MTEPDWTNDPPETIGEALADKHLRIIREATMEPHVYFNIDSHIKNAGPGYVGGRYQVGKKEPLPLAVMLAKLTKIALDHYMQFEDTDTLNENLDKFRQVIDDVRIVEEAPDHD